MRFRSSQVTWSRADTVSSVNEQLPVESEAASWSDLWLLVASAVIVVTRVDRGLIGDPSDWHIWARSQ
jgi:hypothetical protein